MKSIDKFKKNVYSALTRKDKIIFSICSVFFISLLIIGSLIGYKFANKFYSSNNQLNYAVVYADNVSNQKPELTYTEFSSPVYNNLVSYYSFQNGSWVDFVSSPSESSYFVSFLNGVPVFTINSSNASSYYLFEATSLDLLASSDIQNNFTYTILSDMSYLPDGYYSYNIPFSLDKNYTIMQPWNSSDPFSNIGLAVSFGSLSSSFSIPTTLSLTSNSIKLGSTTFLQNYFNFGSFYFESYSSLNSCPNGFVRASTSSHTYLTPFIGTRTYNLGAGGYDLGFSAGYADGHDDGYNAGYKLGHEDGYNSAYSSIGEVVNNFNPYSSCTVSAGCFNSPYYNDYHIDNLPIEVNGYSGWLTSDGALQVETLANSFETNTGLNLSGENFGVRFNFSNTTVGLPVISNSPVSLGYYDGSGVRYYGDFGITLEIALVDLNGSPYKKLSYNNADDRDILRSIDLSDYSEYYISTITIYPSRSDLVTTYSIILGNSFTAGYNSGWWEGYKKAKNEISSSYQSGYQAGYNAGKDMGNYSFFNLIGSIVDAPISYFSSLFDFTILGTNLRAFLLGLFTLSVVLILVRIALGKK